MACLCYCYDVSCRVTFRTEGKSPQDHVIKFAMWQHPSVGCLARCGVPGTARFTIVLPSASYTAVFPTFVAAVVEVRRPV